MCHWLTLRANPDYVVFGCGLSGHVARRKRAGKREGRQEAAAADLSPTAFLCFLQGRKLSQCKTRLNSPESLKENFDVDNSDHLCRHAACVNRAVWQPTSPHAGEHFFFTFFPFIVMKATLQLATGVSGAAGCSSRP